MSKQAQIDQIADAINKVTYAMITSVTSEGHLHSCPMTTAEFGLGAREIWFVGSKGSDLVEDIKGNPHINLAYSSPDEKKYVSINGKAELVEDKDKLDELWSPVMASFYEHGKEDEDIQLIKVVPNGAEYWSSGNGIINIFKMAAAAVQDGKTAEDIGENFSIEL